MERLADPALRNPPERRELVVDGGTAARRHTVTGLAIGSTHKFDVRAVNGIGNGADAEVNVTVAESKLKFRLSMNLWGIRRGDGPAEVVLGFTGHHRAYPLTGPITCAEVKAEGREVNVWLPFTTT